MHLKRLTTLFALSIAFSIGASAQNKCSNSEIATGPFKYTLVSGQPTTYTFVGTGGAPATTAFTVSAPDKGAVFPAESQGGQCSAFATADIEVREIKKVVDGLAVELPSDSPVRFKIASAFTLTPNVYTFGIGESTIVAVDVANPNVGNLDYGAYIVKIKAQAVGTGVGVGSGFEFTLNLQPPAQCADTAAPVVSILKPTAAAKVLGNIKIQVQAYDPAGPCAAGLKSLTATVSSAGGAVKDVAIPLLLNSSLPAAAASIVTGDGVFTPKGGSGSDGTATGQPFTAAYLSGIGTYTLTVLAEDNAGLKSYQHVTFAVNYAVVFTKASVENGCDPNRLGPSCQGKYQWTVNRANSVDADDSSDGLMMFDQTVLAELVNAGDKSVVGTHSYGPGGVGSVVQIDGSAYMYKTNFAHPTNMPYSQFQLVVSFRDVDGKTVAQAVSGPAWF